MSNTVLHHVFSSFERTGGKKIASFVVEVFSPLGGPLLDAAGSSTDLTSFESSRLLQPPWHTRDAGFFRLAGGRSLHTALWL